MMATQCLINYWDAQSNTAPFFLQCGSIHMDSVVNKQVETKFRNFKIDYRDQRTKKQENKGTTKKL